MEVIVADNGQGIPPETIGRIFDLFTQGDQGLDRAGGGLPEMYSYEILKRLRRLRSCEAIQIVAITGYARPEDRVRAIESGFTADLAKPVDIEHISKMLEVSVPTHRRLALER